MTSEFVPSVGTVSRKFKLSSNKSYLILGQLKLVISLKIEFAELISYNLASDLGQSRIVTAKLPLQPDGSSPQ